MWIVEVDRPFGKHCLVKVEINIILKSKIGTISRNLLSEPIRFTRHRNEKKRERGKMGKSDFENLNDVFVKIFGKELIEENLNKEDFNAGQDYFRKNYYSFIRCCGIDFEDNEYKQIPKELGFDVLTLLFAGLSHEFACKSPRYFWNKAAATDIYNFLCKYYNENNDKFLLAFKESVDLLFLGISSYRHIANALEEQGEFSIDDELKLRFFSFPAYTQIIEHCINNIFRFLRDILGNFLDEDFSKQNTAWQLKAIMEKKVFSSSVDIDIDIRNSISHGMFDIWGSDDPGEEIIFRYTAGKQRVILEKKKHKSEFNPLLDNLFDLAGGMIVGVIRFLSNNIEITRRSILLHDEHIRFEWIKLLLLNRKMELINYSKIDDQINIKFRTEITDRDKLLYCLSSICGLVMLFFPDYNRYMIAYEHPRSLMGWIRVHKDQLLNEYNNINEIPTEIPLKNAIDNKDIMFSDIMDFPCDVNAYKYHIFPSIYENGWHIENISDIGVVGHKRIRADLIVYAKLRKNKIKEIAIKAIEKLKTIETKQNPKQNIPFGKIEADVVYLVIYLKSKERYKLGIHPDHEYFICTAIYHKSKHIPQIGDCGFTNKNWSNRFVKEENGKIKYCWNPNLNK